MTISLLKCELQLTSLMNALLLQAFHFIFAYKVIIFHIFLNFNSKCKFNDTSICIIFQKALKSLWLYPDLHFFCLQCSCRHIAILTPPTTEDEERERRVRLHSQVTSCPKSHGFPDWWTTVCLGVGVLLIIIPVCFKVILRHCLLLNNIESSLLKFKPEKIWKAINFFFDKKIMKVKVKS